MDEEFDVSIIFQFSISIRHAQVVICGTGLKECILGGLLSVSGMTLFRLLIFHFVNFLSQEKKFCKLIGTAIMVANQLRLI